jgi:hypothetical protein
MAALTAVVLAASGGCAWGRDDEPSDGLAPDTARFTYGDRQVEVPLTSCGRDPDRDVVLLAGRRGAVVVQAAADLGDGGLDRTGVTADLGAAGILGAFGAELDQGPAGEISDVRTDGDRLIVEGTWVTLDAELEATEQTPAGQAAAGVEGELRARCPADDGGDGETAATAATAARSGPGVGVAARGHGFHGGEREVTAARQWVPPRWAAPTQWVPPGV